MLQPPRLYVIAGSNGSGKTTFARRFLPVYANCFEFVNTDLIAEGLSPFSPDNVAFQAGKLVLARIHELARKRVSFAFETTLSGRMHVSLFRQLKEEGYLIDLLYLWIPSPRLAMKRIAERVAAGGHSIPNATVVRRFSRSLSNFLSLYWALCDNILLFDNADVTPRLIAAKRSDTLEVFDENLFARVRRMANRERI